MKTEVQWNVGHCVLIFVCGLITLSVTPDLYLHIFNCSTQSVKVEKKTRLNLNHCPVFAKLLVQICKYVNFFFLIRSGWPVNKLVLGENSLKGATVSIKNVVQWPQHVLVLLSFCFSQKIKNSQDKWKEKWETYWRQLHTFIAYHLIVWNEKRAHMNITYG